MAQQQGGQQHRRNRNKGGGGPKCSLCPDHGRDGQRGNPQPNGLPTGRPACYACAPEMKIVVSGDVGSDKRFHVAVSVTENGQPKGNAAIQYMLTGSSGWQSLLTDATGSKIFSVDCGEHEAKLSAVLEGSAEKAEFRVPAKSELGAVDTTKPVDEFVISAEISRGVVGNGDTAVITVRTTKNGHPFSTEFAYVVGGVYPRLKEQTSDGTSEFRKEKLPLGSWVQVFETGERPRPVKFWCTKGRSNTVEVIIPAAGEFFQPEEVPVGAKIEITADIVKSGDEEYEVLIQTYVNGKQVGLWFAYAVGDDGYVYDHTADGRNSGEPAGVCLLSLSVAKKERELRLHVIGAEADIRKLKLPATKKKFKPKPVNTQAGFWRNMLGE